MSGVNLDDTIVAIATPPGRGGIGVVRLAGPDAVKIASPMLRLTHPLEPGRAGFGELVEVSGGAAELGSAGRPGAPVPTWSVPAPTAGVARRIDEVVVIYFARPHSYTTDDIIEISAHGSPVVLRHIVEMSVAAGARLAEPGEFTMRAFLNGRIDLTQAEAVRDLIDSRTLYQARVAAQQLEGALSRRLQPVKKELVELIARLEAGIDFAEDDVSVMPDAAILAQIEAIHVPLRQLHATAGYGQMVHEGLTLAIVGRPNVGKSSLFNRLVERERAIVTATPGTTRDLVTETVAIGGIPVQLVDTAGIRHALDEAESIGIQKSKEALADADLVLVVVDASQAETAEDEELLRLVEGRPATLVQNKCDLDTGILEIGRVEIGAVEIGRAEIGRVGVGRLGVGMPQVAPFLQDLGTARGHASEARNQIIRTSAITGEGIAELRAAILNQVAGESGAQIESGFLTNVRHEGLIKDALAALNAATNAVAGKVPHEMLLMDLYNALHPLDAITGATTTDDILNLIFSTFCIGK